MATLELLPVTNETTMRSMMACRKARVTEWTGLGVAAWCYVETSGRSPSTSGGAQKPAVCQGTPVSIWASAALFARYLRNFVDGFCRDGASTCVLGLGSRRSRTNRDP